MDNTANSIKEDKRDRGGNTETRSNQEGRQMREETEREVEEVKRGKNKEDFY